MSKDFEQENFRLRNGLANIYDALKQHLHEKERILKKGIEYRQEELKQIEFTKKFISEVYRNAIK